MHARLDCTYHATPPQSPRSPCGRKAPVAHRRTCCSAPWSHGSQGGTCLLGSRAPVWTCCLPVYASASEIGPPGSLGPFDIADGGDFYLSGSDRQA
eukprot:s1018_g2.t1